MSKSKNTIIRIFGIIIGMGLIVVGISLLHGPIFNDLTEKLNSITFIILGVVFFIYGLTGKSSLRNN